MPDVLCFFVLRVAEGGQDAMHFHVLTLFPEMIVQGMGVSITGRAMEKGIISVNAVNIRDYSKDKHRHCDDAPYGGEPEW